MEVKIGDFVSYGRHGFPTGFVTYIGTLAAGGKNGWFGVKIEGPRGEPGFIPMEKCYIVNRDGFSIGQMATNKPPAGKSFAKGFEAGQKMARKLKR